MPFKLHSSNMCDSFGKRKLEYKKNYIFKMHNKKISLLYKFKYIFFLLRSPCCVSRVLVVLSDYYSEVFLTARERSNSLQKKQREKLSRAKSEHGDVTKSVEHTYECVYNLVLRNLYHCYRWCSSCCFTVKKKIHSWKCH